jgi:hypothetical protein
MEPLKRKLQAKKLYHSGHRTYGQGLMYVMQSENLLQLYSEIGYEGKFELLSMEHRISV